MSLLLSSERSLAASRTLSPLKIVANRIAEMRRKQARRASLLSLLEMEDHRLYDLGFTRPELVAALHARRTPRRAERAISRRR